MGADPALVAIARSVSDIQGTWAKLGAIEAARSPAYQRYADEFGNRLPPGWDNTTTLEWSGPIEPLARFLAKNAGYGFETLGTQPATPVIVTIVAEQPTPLGFLLRDAGFQAGARAGVVLHDDRVSVVYPD